MSLDLCVHAHTSAESLVLYACDTFYGSSGAPVLFTKEDEVVLLAVHCKRAISMMDAGFQKTSIGYKVGSVLSEGFLRCLYTDNQSMSNSTV